MHAILVLSLALAVLSTAAADPSPAANITKRQTLYDDEASYRDAGVSLSSLNVDSVTPDEYDNLRTSGLGETEVSPLAIDPTERGLDLKNDRSGAYAYADTYGGVQAGAIADATAYADYDPVTMSGGNSYPLKPLNVNSDVISRVVYPNEMISPQQIAGAENVMVCTVAGEIHRLWARQECFVCVCVGSNLGPPQPVCVSCSGCAKPPPPPANPHAISPPLLPTPPASPCNPLPAGVPFQNPLNPCQMCICNAPVPNTVPTIVCEHSPNCVIPEQAATTLPPLPSPPAAVPLPTCERFPPNVVFPHPTDKCQQCQCLLIPSQIGPPQQSILCEPNPECMINEQAEAIAEVSSVRPRPPPPPPVQNAVPWPPRHGRTRGPLPGTPPHQSCQPYPPETPFQHPWDDCQVCVCSEARNMNAVSVEVYCYTKEECCIVPGPDGSSTLALPQASSMPDKICEFKTLGVEFTSPQDTCRLCTCRTTISGVSASCRRDTSPVCMNRPPDNSEPAHSLGWNPGSSTLWPPSSPNTGFFPGETIATPSINYGPPSSWYPQSGGGSFSPSGQSQAVANSIAQYNANQFYPGFSFGDSSADAQAQAQAVNQFQQYGTGTLPSYYPVPSNTFTTGSQGYPFVGYKNSPSFDYSGSGTQGTSDAFGLSDFRQSAQASADASATTQSEYSPYGRPNNNPYLQPSGLESAQASADATAQSGYAPFNSYAPSYNNYPQQNSRGVEGTQAQAYADVSASTQPEYTQQGYTQQVNSPYSSYGPSNNLYLPQTYQPTSQSQAIADASATSQAGYSPYSPYGPVNNQFPQSGSAQATASGSQAVADASATSQAGYSPNSPYGPGNTNMYPQLGGAQATADASATSQAGYSPSPYYPYGPGGAQAQATAESSATSQKPSPYGPYTAGRNRLPPGSSSYPSPFASPPTANAYPYSGPGPGVGASDLYPSLYPKPVTFTTPLYSPNHESASASSSANGQSAQATADASSAGGKGKCKYAGDMYHEHCQACSCVRESNGQLRAICHGPRCSVCEVEVAPKKLSDWELGITPRRTSRYTDHVATTLSLVHIDDMSDVADVEAHRGHKWYHYTSKDSSKESDVENFYPVSSISESDSSSDDSASTSDVSSVETRERTRLSYKHRVCTPCPEMVQKHTNRDIRWICGKYQRARRTFKSICMMRYRNCEDGTLFVKVREGRCPNDTYHGRHWFYEYKV